MRTRIPDVERLDLQQVQAEIELIEAEAGRIGQSEEGLRRFYPGLVNRLEALRHRRELLSALAKNPLRASGGGREASSGGSPKPGEAAAAPAADADVSAASRAPTRPASGDLAPLGATEGSPVTKSKAGREGRGNHWDLASHLISDPEVAGTARRGEDRPPLVLEPEPEGRKAGEVGPLGFRSDAGLEDEEAESFIERWKARAFGAEPQTGESGELDLLDLEDEIVVGVPVVPPGPRASGGGASEGLSAELVLLGEESAELETRLKEQSRNYEQAIEELRADLSEREAAIGALRSEKAGMERRHDEELAGLRREIEAQNLRREDAVAELRRELRERGAAIETLRTEKAGMLLRYDQELARARDRHRDELEKRGQEERERSAALDAGARAERDEIVQEYENRIESFRAAHEAERDNLALSLRASEESWRDEKAGLEADRDALRVEQEKLVERHREAEERWSAEKTAVEADGDRANEERAKLADALASAEEQRRVERVSLEAERDLARKDRDDARAEIDRLRTDLDAARARENTLNGDLAQLRAEGERLAEANRALAAESTRLAEEHRDLARQAEDAGRENLSLTMRVEQLHEEATGLRREVAELRAGIDSERERWRKRSELIERHLDTLHRLATLSAGSQGPESDIAADTADLGQGSEAGQTREEEGPIKSE